MHGQQNVKKFSSFIIISNGFVFLDSLTLSR